MGPNSLYIWNFFSTNCKTITCLIILYKINILDIFRTSKLWKMDFVTCFAAHFIQHWLYIYSIISIHIIISGLRNLLKQQKWKWWTLHGFQLILSNICYVHKHYHIYYIIYVCMYVCMYVLNWLLCKKTSLLEQQRFKKEAQPQ